MAVTLGSFGIEAGSVALEPQTGPGTIRICTRHARARPHRLLWIIASCSNCA